MTAAGWLALASFPGGIGTISAVRAENAASWSTAAEAEAARAAAEEKARALGQEYMKKNEYAGQGEEALEEAMAELEALEEAAEAAREKAEKAAPDEKAAADRALAEAEEALRETERKLEKLEQRVQKAREEADAAYEKLAAAAMELKEATEASVRMARVEAIDDSRISGSFALGERFGGRFNDRMEPLYVRFEMNQDARVRISTSQARVSVSVLDAGGNTILTLVPSSSGKGSLCSLSQGEYTFLIAAMGGEEKNISVSVTEADEEYIPPAGSDPEGEETEMETLVEFD